MPIEIRELQIRVSVSQPDQGEQGGSATQTSPPAPESLSTPDKIVADAVEQVFELLRNKNER